MKYQLQGCLWLFNPIITILFNHQCYPLNVSFKNQLFVGIILSLSFFFSFIAKTFIEILILCHLEYYILFLIAVTDTYLSSTIFSHSPATTVILLEKTLSYNLPAVQQDMSIIPLFKDKLLSFVAYRAFLRNHELPHKHQMSLLPCSLCSGPNTFLSLISTLHFYIFGPLLIIFYSSNCPPPPGKLISLFQPCRNVMASFPNTFRKNQCNFMTQKVL